MDHAVNWKDLPVRLEVCGSFHPNSAGWLIVDATVHSGSLNDLSLQDSVQQHLLQSRDGHGQRDVGALQSPSFQ